MAARDRAPRTGVAFAQPGTAEAELPKEECVYIPIGLVALVLIIILLIYLL